MILALIVVLAVFPYALCAHLVYRAILHDDPPTNYRDEDVAFVGQDGRSYTRNARCDHELYMVASAFWPVRIAWLLIVGIVYEAPRRVALKIEKHLDKIPDPQNAEPDGVYRGEQNRKSK